MVAAVVNALYLCSPAAIPILQQPAYRKDV